MNGHCAICKFYGHLFTDHSHLTGCIRGYVCNRCNTVLGTIERGTHHHESYHFVVNGTFVVDVDCSSYHSYLRNSPLERFNTRYRK